MIGPTRMPAVLLGLVLLTPVARGESSPPTGSIPPADGVWEELTLRRAGPLSRTDARWVHPSPASFLRIEAGATPVLIRVDLDDDGAPVAQVEQRLSRLEDGSWVAWIPPSPASPHAVVATGRLRASALRAVEDLAASAVRPGSAAMPGQRLGVGWRPLSAGQPLLLPARGRGLLRLTIRPTDEAAPPGAVTPFDLVVSDPSGPPLDRLPSSSVVRAEPRRPSTAVRELNVWLGPTTTRVQLASVGAASEIRARLYRPRGSLFRARNTVPWAPRPLGEEGEVSLAALAAGDHRAASFHLAPWLEGSPGDADALWILARVQARVEALPGLVPAALPGLETAVIEADSSGGSPAPDRLRAAARHAWLQTSTYSTRGVEVPGGGTSLVEQLDPTAPVLQLDVEAQRKAGVRWALSGGETGVVTVPAQSGAADRWGVLRWLGFNGSGRPAVVGLSVDGGDPIRILLADPATPFRLALPPGEHRVELLTPPGAEDRFTLAVDRPLGGPARGRLQLRDAVPVGPLVPTARVELPGVYEVHATSGTPDAPTHLWLDAWWEGEGPLELSVEAADGERRVTVHPVDRVVALVDAPRRGGPAALATGGAAVDLPLSAGWIRIHGTGEGWVRVRHRRPAPRPLEVDAPPPRADIAAIDGDLAQLSRRVMDSPDDAAEAAARYRRAEWLLDSALEDYALRDLVAAQLLPDADPEILSALAQLDRVTRRLQGPDHLEVLDPGERVAVALDLPAAAGHGPPAWLDDLPQGAHPRLLAEGRVRALAAAGEPSPALPRELARRALAAAQDDPERALEALLHAVAVREVVDDAAAARIVAVARDATRADPLLAADHSADRVILYTPATLPDRLADPARWARWTLLGAGMDRVDRVVAGGTRWVVTGLSGVPEQLRLTAFCDDLRVPPPATPPHCRLSIEGHGSGTEVWEIPRGEVSSRQVPTGGATELAFGLADAGAARYVALSLDGEGGTWGVPDRRAAFHVARPGEPVGFTLAGPTRLSVEAARRSRGSRGSPADVQILVDGEIRATLGDSGAASPPPILSDQGVEYGPILRTDLSVDGDGVHRLELRSRIGTTAVRVTRRMASETVLPPILGDTLTPPGGPVPGLPQAPEDGDLLPLPSRGGTLEVRAALRDRWSVDFEPVDERDVYLETTALHRLRVGGGLWLRGSLFGRFRFVSTPSAGARLGLHQRLGPTGLRWSGGVTALVQDTSEGHRGALAIRARLDRPLRLGSRALLVPHLDLRAHVQPQVDLDAVAGEADLELASTYRRQHPFGLGAGIELLWRPWTDVELLLAGRARSNPDPTSLDSAGGRVQVRAHPRPVGLALGFDLSRRLRDSDREDAWWRSELALDLWADLGPPTAWIRPEARLAYLLDPTRLEVTVGIAVLPGRRSLDHVAPTELHFEDIRRDPLQKRRARR